MIPNCILCLHDPTFSNFLRGIKVKLKLKLKLLTWCQVSGWFDLFYTQDLPGACIWREKSWLPFPDSVDDKLITCICMFMIQYESHIDGITDKIQWSNLLSSLLKLVTMLPEYSQAFTENWWKSIHVLLNCITSKRRSDIFWLTLATHGQT